MIELKDISVIFNQGKRAITAVTDVDLTIERGDVYGIVGYSGAGKSTLVRVINLLQRPTTGSVIVDGTNLTDLVPRALRKKRKSIGMIFQHFNLMDSRTIFDNVDFSLKYTGKKKIDRQKKVLELLELVGLGDKANAYPSQLSGGQKQRVAIARALANDPEILLCDEATSALDPNTTTSILNLLKEINEKLNITIVIVTHEMEVVKQIAQKALLLEHGNIIGFDDTEELFLKPDIKMKEFLGETEVVPKTGVNVKLYFPKDNVFQSFITKMARELNMDFNIVWGKLEEINGHIVGNMVINIEDETRDIVIDYIRQHDIVWEVL